MVDAVVDLKNTVRPKEIVGHAVAGVGQNLIFGLWSSYMLVFFTDVLGIAGGVAGLIMMFTRVWDAINDPMMGMIADHTRTKWGRYRPWLLFMSVPMIVFLCANFSAPDFSMTGKIVWASVTYVSMSMVYTAIDVPYWTLPAAMSNDSNKRTLIYSVSRTSTTLSSLIVGIVAIPLVLALGKGDMAKGYFFAALIIGIAAAVLYLIGFSVIREHVETPPQEKFVFKDAIQVIVQNKPLLLIILSMVLAFSASFIRTNLLVYYVQYNIGKLELVAMFNLIQLPSMITGVVISPIIVKKIGQKNLFIAACAFAAIVNTVFYFGGYGSVNFTLAMFFLASIPMGVTMVLISSMIANTIEYAEWKTGQRREGLISSTQTFLAKLCMAIGGGLSGLILTISHYTPNTAQLPETLSSFHFWITLVVAIGMAVGIIPMLFNDYDDKMQKRITAELAARHAAKAN